MAMRMYHFTHPENPGDALVFHDDKYGPAEDNQDYKDCVEDGLEITGVFILELLAGKEALPGMLAKY